MRGGVDAAREARHDAETMLAQRAREPLGKFHAGGGRIARTDDRHQRPLEHGQLAAHRQERRRIVDHLQTRRIIRLAQCDEFDAAGAGGSELCRCFFGRADARRPRCTAAPRQAGQCRERRARAAEIIDQVAKGARARGI